MKKSATFIVFLIVFVMSCTTATKDDYLSRYKQFIQQVQSEHNKYTEDDWIKADRRLNNINNILTKRFKNKLTKDDKITMGIYRMRYDYYRYAGKVKDIEDYVDSLLEEDVEILIRSGLNFLSDSIDSIFGEQ